MKEKFKEYDKEYEDVFSGERSLKVIKWDKISNDLGLTNLQFIDQYREYGRLAFAQMFDVYVKLTWWRAHFMVNTKKIGISGHKPHMVHLHALHIVTRNIIGLDFSVIKKNTFFYKITTYFPDFFPLFYENNPFENPEYYNFPYQHVTPDFLFLVYQMPERLDLLDIAEKKKMVFGKFLDYVINYVMCYNNDHGKQIYTFMSIGKGSPFYIRYNKGNKHSRHNAKKQLGKSLNL